MIKTIIDFKKLQEELPKKIAESPYKTTHFIKELGLSSATYYRKAGTNKFTADEMLKIVELVNPKEYYKWLFEQEIEEAKAELEAGKGISNEEAIRIISSKITAKE